MSMLHAFSEGMYVYSEGKTKLDWNTEPRYISGMNHFVTLVMFIAEICNL